MIDMGNSALHSWSKSYQTFATVGKVLIRNINCLNCVGSVQKRFIFMAV